MIPTGRALLLAAAVLEDKEQSRSLTPLEVVNPRKAYDPYRWGPRVSSCCRRGKVSSFSQLHVNANGLHSTILND